MLYCASIFRRKPRSVGGVARQHLVGWRKALGGHAQRDDHLHAVASVRVLLDQRIIRIEQIPGGPGIKGGDNDESDPIRRLRRPDRAWACRQVHRAAILPIKETASTIKGLDTNLIHVLP